MLELLGLRGDGGADARMGVAEEIDPPRADGVEVAFAVEVLEPHPAAAADGNRRQVLVVAHLRARVPQHAQIALGP